MGAERGSCEGSSGAHGAESEDSPALAPRLESTGVWHRRMSNATSSVRREAICVLQGHRAPQICLGQR